MARHTHHPRAAEAHQPAPAHLAEMLDSLSDGFMSLDKSWRFTYLNNTAERYLQQARKNLLGREIWQCYPDLVNSGYYQIYRHTAATGVPAATQAITPRFELGLKPAHFATMKALRYFFATSRANTSTPPS